MYRKFIITSLAFIIITGKVFSAGDCLIKDSPAPALSKYIENNKIVLKNITKGITNSGTKKSQNSNVLSMFNKIITWDNYGSYFKYYVSFPIANDVSSEVKRDYSMLDNEWKWLTEYLNKIIKLWYNNVEIKNICEWIAPEECSLEWTASKIVWELIKNQSAIINIYRLTVMWDTTEINKENILQLVDNTKFIDELEKHYWFWKNCTASDWSFFATIMEKIKKIEFKNDKYKGWIKEWKDAWNLLVWNKTDKKLEENLLKKELAKQWISWARAEAVIGNLKKYNQGWWMSIDNNYVANTFTNLAASIQRETREFKKDIFSDFWKDEGSKTITITNILGKDDENTLTESIAKKVSELYNTELPFIAIWDTNTEMIRTDIIDMHNNLNKSIDILNNKTCEVAVKVCKDQDTQNWNCWKCNK